MTHTLTAKAKSKHSDEIYAIQITQAKGDIETSCTCRAGQNHDLCWHVEAVINGEVDKLVFDGDTSKAEQIIEFIHSASFKNSAFKRAYDEWIEACEQFDRATVKKRKKRDRLKKLMSVSTHSNSKV